MFTSTYDTQLSILALFHAVHVAFTELYITLFTTRKVMGDPTYI